MRSAVRDIFRAIHEQKWLSIEYRNKDGETTHYWIGINWVDPVRRRLKVDGLHLGNHQMRSLDCLYLDSILGASILDGTYHKTPQNLLQAIEEDARYENVFGCIPNLRILDYYYDCVRLNEVPYAKNYSLISRLDADSFRNGAVRLDDQQFAETIRLFQADAKKTRESKSAHKSKRIALNLLSLHSSKGLYVLAYRELRLDVNMRVLAIGKTLKLNHEFCIVAGKTRESESIRRYLDESEMPLLENFEAHAEQIKNCIAHRCGMSVQVDDEPHVYVIQRYEPTFLQAEYAAIVQMHREDKLSYPLKAFFGSLVRRPVRIKEWPLSLYRENANLDQLLAINQAIKYPLTYVQGPPGTGKTSTIENAIVNAFCNGRTVLFASNNNHPVDGVVNDLSSMKLGDEIIPFPILRLGNVQRLREALDYMRELYTATADVVMSRAAPRFADDDSKQKTEQLAGLLKEYEERVDLEERRSCIEALVSSNQNLNFIAHLEGGQKTAIDEQLVRMHTPEELDRQIRELTHGSHDDLMRFLMVASVFRIKRLGEPRNAELLDIVMSDDEDTGEYPDSRSRKTTETVSGSEKHEEGVTRVKRFVGYLSESQNVKALLRIFPIIATTCMSAYRIGNPEPLFNMTIIDEASQCDAALALVPIVRGESLMLVGDPQQLNPVITVDQADSDVLRQSYGIGKEYDYVRNSLYKTFLACDAVSSEILLRAHYRCDERIIEFNNKKYYGGYLRIMSGRRLPEALEFIDVALDSTTVKNTAPSEADAVVSYALSHPQQEIGVITPFANQRAMIEEALEQSRVPNATCGTIHSYQGDEKEVVLFSLALTERTADGTYAWLSDNRELINVATSRARDKLIIVGSEAQVRRLHASQPGVDDLYELVEYVKSRGVSSVTPRRVTSRALGVKPYSTQTETAFFESLNHALDTIFMAGNRHSVRHEVPG